jgi:hypothetical protein
VGPSSCPHSFRFKSTEKRLDGGGTAPVLGNQYLDTNICRTPVRLAIEQFERANRFWHSFHSCVPVNYHWFFTPVRKPKAQRSATLQLTGGKFAPAESRN